MSKHMEQTDFWIQPYYRVWFTEYLITKILPYFTGTEEEMRTYLWKLPMYKMQNSTSASVRYGLYGEQYNEFSIR